MIRGECSLIKELLIEKEINQKKLSELTGITESAISRYVKGERTPRGKNLVKIAKALGVTTDDLLFGEHEVDRNSELTFAKALIARNASEMTLEEKMEFVKLLMDKGGTDETQ